MHQRVDTMSDTIVACATPPGEGALAVVRLSGPHAIQLGQRIAPRKRVASHSMALARVLDAYGRLLDQALVVEMHAPRSFTGEDVVELHLHGSRAVVASVITTCCQGGARLARPGEFSLRAFLNGRLDLAQAEAIADLVASSNQAQQGIAASQLAGQLSKTLSSLLERLERVMARWRAVLDFPEQVDHLDDPEGDAGELEEVTCRIQDLIDHARPDLRQGMRVVLCGAPNVGKSTLLNAWAGRDRVLVDAEPGTTRDPVEVDLSSDAARWVVCDTAGIRRDASGLEARGIQMSREQIGHADVALWLLDPGRPAWPDPDLDVRIVGAKSDLAPGARRKELEAEARKRDAAIECWVSPLSGEGVDALRRLVLSREGVTAVDEGVAVVVRERHLEALSSAKRLLAQAREGLLTGATLDVLLADLEEGARALGAVIGRDVDAAVLDRIFSEFCLGK